MSIINKIALILVIVGAINWGAVALFSFDAVAWISGGGATLLAKIILTHYIIISYIQAYVKHKFPIFYRRKPFG